MSDKPSEHSVADNKIEEHREGIEIEVPAAKAKTLTSPLPIEKDIREENDSTNATAISLPSVNSYGHQSDNGTEIESEKEIELDAFEKCHICTEEVYDEVWVKECYHSLCRECFQLWAEHLENLRNGVTCPVCRKWVTGYSG